MSHSSFRLFLYLAVLLIGGAPAWAQYDEGQRAFDSQDYPKAKAAWQIGAAAGDAASQYSLGYLAQFGLTGAVDLARAKSWYESAAAGGNADALYALGLMYETGSAGEKDLGKALAFYRSAAAAGVQSDAEYAIGRMLLRGQGTARNPAESVLWLKKSAQRGNPAAEYMLAAAFEAGWGVPVNDGEAYYWYRRADQGDPVELQEQDTAFAPKIAIAALRRRLPAAEIAKWDARLKKEAAATARVAARGGKSTPTVASPALTAPAPH
jgi:TPR repeat protein